MRRREFLKSIGALGTTSLGAERWMSGKTHLIETESADKRSLDRVGIQLYTVRSLLEPEFEATLARVGEIGFDEVEFAGYFGHPAPAIARQLDDIGLKAPAAHMTTEDGNIPIGEAVDIAKVLGHDYIVWAWIEEEERQSLDDYRRFADRFNQYGEACQQAGIQFCYHNHDFEFRAFVEGEQEPFDLLLEKTDPSLVQIELDLYWLSKAGRSPVPYVKAHPGRFPLFHMKDMMPTAERGFAELGKGTLDFPDLLQSVPRAKTKHFFYEQDETNVPIWEAVQTGYEFLTALRY